jgi:hypothetical protein
MIIMIYRLKLFFNKYENKLNHGIYPNSARP